MQQPDCRCMTHDTLVISWWSQSGSNRRPSRCKRDALPAELWPRPFETGFADAWTQFNLVGLGGVEPPTSPLSGVRSNQLSYRPLWRKVRACVGLPASGAANQLNIGTGNL